MYTPSGPAIRGVIGGRGCATGASDWNSGSAGGTAFLPGRLICNWAGSGAGPCAGGLILALWADKELVIRKTRTTEG